MPRLVEARLVSELVRFGADFTELGLEATFEALGAGPREIATIARIVEHEFGVVVAGLSRWRTVGELIADVTRSLDPGRAG